MADATTNSGWLRRWGRDLVQDLHFAHRSLLRAPMFAVTAVLTLAFGIGANVALFSVVDGVLLQPLPFPQPAQLIRVWSFSPVRQQRGSPSLPDYREFRRENRTLEALGAYSFAAYSATGGERSELLLALRITASTWDVLKTPPLLGRVFDESANTWGRHDTAVISHQLWQRRFGGDAGVIGRPLELDGQRYRIAAVMPESFAFGGAAIQLWTPLAFVPGDVADSRQMFFIDLLGRMKPGVTQAQAQQDLSRVARDLDRRFTLEGLGVVTQDWQESVVGQARPTLLLLFGAVGLVLLIACANVANLLLARATTREHELTVRTALGAGRGRLARQLLAESLAIASLGGACGMLIALALVAAIPALGPVGVPRLDNVALDWRAMVFAAGVAMATGIVFGILPARQAGRIGLAGRLTDAARAIVGGGRGRVRRVLATTELSLSLVLLVGAALLVVSLQRVQAVDPGFRPERLFTARLNLPQAQYRDPEHTRAFVRQAVAAVSAVPGVQSAGITTTLPLGDGDWGRLLTIDGRPVPTGFSNVPSIRYRIVTPDYFRTLGAEVRRGRVFTAQDGEGAPLVAVVNDTAARRFWPGADPLRQRISVNPPESLVPSLFPRPDGSMRFPRLTIVGVIADFRQNGLEAEAQPEVFVPFAQSGEQAGFMHFLAARTANDPLSATRAIEAAIQQVDPNVPLADLRSMERRLEDSMARRRVVMLVLGGFAGLALLLAMVGVYGVMALAVSQRRAEFGLRSALGASAGEILRMVLIDGFWMTATATAVGLAIAVALSSFIAGLLFEVAPLDASIYVGATVALATVATLACAVPAWRAARMSPCDALRG